MTKRRTLKCACCGGNAGQWAQHWNQDTGWGICRACVDWLLDERSYDQETIQSIYGKEGVNFAPKEKKHGVTPVGVTDRADPGGT